MPETFVRLSQWLRAPMQSELCDAATGESKPPVETPCEETLYSSLRRLRAAVLEALESADRDALERVRVHANALLEEAG